MAVNSKYFQLDIDELTINKSRDKRFVLTDSTREIFLVSYLPTYPLKICIINVSKAAGVVRKICFVLQNFSCYCVCSIWTFITLNLYLMTDSRLSWPHSISWYNFLLNIVWFRYGTCGMPGFSNLLFCKLTFEHNNFWKEIFLWLYKIDIWLACI